MDYQKLFQIILENAVKNKASDIHIVVGHPPIIRAAGLLSAADQEKIISPEDAKGIAEFLMTPQRQERFLREKEIDFA